MNAPRSASATLLLVDDLDENLFALAALLARDGVTILQASSGAAALELLLAHPIDLALIDLQMPEMDGFELAELMRGSERTKGVPIIFVTAGASDEQRLFKGYEAGAVDFLQKPIEPRVLQSKVDVFVELAQQRRRLACEVDEKTERLRLNEMFTAMLGHDLRRPLSVILMNAALQEKRTVDAESARTAARTREAAERMGRMISDMLDLARARVAGGIRADRRPTDLRPIVEKALDVPRADGDDRPLRTVWHGTFEGSWDADRLAQVAINLVDNAIRHGAPGREIVCELDGRDPDEVVLSIGNGGTIPADLLPQIFDPFRSRDPHRARGDGLGLGLFIVQQIVFAHRGAIDVETGTNDRTTFRIALPRV